MPLLSIVFGLALIAIGLEGYTNQFGFFNVDKPYSFTALIPAFFGAVLMVCGILAFWPDMRKHMMHMAALAGLIGAGAGLGMSGPKLTTLFSKEYPPDFRPAPVHMQFMMGLFCLAYVLLAIRSFLIARRRRKAAGL